MNKDLGIRNANNFRERGPGDPAGVFFGSVCKCGTNFFRSEKAVEKVKEER